MLEFFSYVLCFHTLLVGPFAFYDDYCQFIDGSNITTAEQNGYKMVGIFGVLGAVSMDEITRHIYLYGCVCGNMMLIC